MQAKSRGFIPLLAIVVLGLILAAGGTIATVSLRTPKAEPAPTTTVEVATTTTVATEGAPLGPVSSRVESLEGSSGVEGSSEKPAPIEEIVDEQALQVYAVCAGFEHVTTNSGTESLIGDIKGLCEKYWTGNSEQRREWAQTITEKQNLWEIAESQKRDDEFRKRVEEGSSQQQPEKPRVEDPQQAVESYTESETYPIILSFADNHGNAYKGSDYNGYQGPHSLKKKAALRVGDTITATVEAKDPKGRTLEYNWNASSQHFNDIVARTDGAQGSYKYTPSNTLSYTLTMEDLQSSGETFRLVWQVRVAGTEFYRFGGGQYDDTGFIDYTLQP